MTNTITEIETVELENVCGGAGGFWGQFGLNVASKAIQGAMAGAQQGAQAGRPILGALKGAGMAALGAVSQGLGAAAQGG